MPRRAWGAAGSGGWGTVRAALAGRGSGSHAARAAQVALPEEALFLLRYQKFLSLTAAGGAYRHLLSAEDAAMVPLLAAFQKLAVYRRVELPASALRGAAFEEYYSQLIAKYLGPDEHLLW